MKKIYLNPKITARIAGSIITGTTTCFDFATINRTQTEICVYFYAKKEGI